MLLDEEARSLDITRDELAAREIAAKTSPVSEEDVVAFYARNVARLGGRPLDEIGGRIRDFLAERNEARDEYAAGLRNRARVEVFLESPRLSIAVAEGERVKGPARGGSGRGSTRTPGAESRWE